MVHTLDVNPAPGHIGCHQHPDLAGLEVLESTHPFSLLNVAGHGNDLQITILAELGVISGVGPRQLIDIYRLRFHK